MLAEPLSWLGVDNGQGKQGGSFLCPACMALSPTASCLVLPSPLCPHPQSDGSYVDCLVAASPSEMAFLLSLSFQHPCFLENLPSLGQCPSSAFSPQPELATRILLLNDPCSKW